MKKLIIVIAALSGITGLLLNNSKKLDTNVDVNVNGELTLEDSSFSKTNSLFHNSIELDDEIVDFENNFEVKETENNTQNVVQNKETIKKEEQNNVNSNSDTVNKKQNTVVTENNVKEEEKNNNDKEVKSTNSVTNEEKKAEESNKEVVEEKVNDKVEMPKEKETPKNETTPKLNKFQMLNDNNKTVILVDRSGEYCAQALDYFYEDSQYVYYFTCKKSGSMYVIKNGQEYKLVEALKTGVTTIKELEENGYSFLKKAKNYLTK